MTFPTLNMIGWRILDYELALDGLRRLDDAVIWLENQPRAGANHRLHPGAEFLVQFRDEWVHHRVDDIVESLRESRFPDAEDDERRVRLLIHYESDHGPAGTPIPDLIQMVLQQSIRPAA